MNLAAIVLALSLLPPTVSEVTLRVVDATTSAAVPTATVALDGRSLPVDAEGRLTVALPANRASLVVRAPGYVERTIDVEPGGAGALEIALVSRGAFREQVDVRAISEPATDAPGAASVRPNEVMEVAGGAENVFRVLQTLPGVASPEDFSSRISVRGGGPDENLTVMDGVEIHNPYRLFGLVSAFNPETVDSFELTAGGFGAAYGDRLSSLLVIHNRAGSTERGFTGSGALSLTDSNVILEGRMPRGSGSWLITGRRTYYDLVAERFTDQDLPSFNDLQGKSVFRLGGGRTLSLFSLRSREATDASFDNPKEGAKGAVFTRTRNDLLAATFETPLGRRGVSRTVVSGYTNTDSVDFGGDFRDETRRSNAPGQTAFDTTNIAVTWDGTVRDLALREELTLQTSSRHVLEAGGELHRLRTRVRFTIPGARNNTEANSSSLQGGAGLPEDLDSSRDDTRVGAWLQDRFTISSRVSLDAGLRLDRSSVNDQTSVSPRFSGTVALTPGLRLRGALGLYTQSPGYEKLVQADYFVDLSSPGPLALQSERARHALLSLERDLPGGVLLRTAAYYKRFDRMIVGRLETPEETAARIAEYEFPQALAANVPRDPFITTFPTNDARGHAYGFDVYVSRPARQAPTRLTGWASYTYGVATREAYGRSFPFDYDRRHAVTAVANLRLTQKLTLSTTARLASGFPRTPVLGLRVASAPDTLDLDGDGNHDELVPDRDAGGLLVYTTDLGGVDNLNTARLPHYERLDARLTYMPRGPNGRVKLYVDVINVLARKNAGLLSPTLEYDPASDRPRLVEKADGSMPFLPSFGVHVNLGGLSGRPGTKTPTPGPPRVGGPWAIAARPLGTQGLGLEVTRALWPRLNARLGFGFGASLGIEERASGTDYAIQMPLGGADARLDFHPFGGGFHLSGGVLRTRHHFDIEAKPADSFVLGETSYRASDVGRLAGEARVRQWAPYFGLGWGNALGKGKRFGLVFDVGVAPQGRPVVTLSANGEAAGSAAFRESLALETQDVAARLQGWRLFPVVSLGFSRRF